MNVKYKMVRYFTWSEFDKNVMHISNKCKFRKFSGIYGIPRGGLCLAVALSHRLNIKLISKPKKNCLIVDDILDTGLTLNTLKNIEGAMFFVLFSKREPTWFNTVNLSEQKEWVVFPWENDHKYLIDQKQYINKRKLN